MIVANAMFSATVSRQPCRFASDHDHSLVAIYGNLVMHYMDGMGGIDTHRRPGPHGHPGRIERINDYNNVITQGHNCAPGIGKFSLPDKSVYSLGDDHPQNDTDQFE